MSWSSEWHSCLRHVNVPLGTGSSYLFFLLPVHRCRSRTSRGSWSAPSARSSSPTRSSCHVSTASATSACASCSCWTTRTPLMRARSAPCPAAPGPGCPRPPWRGWTGWSDQVRLLVGATRAKGGFSLWDYCGFYGGKLMWAGLDHCSNDRWSILGE